MSRLHRPAPDGHDHGHDPAVCRSLVAPVSVGPEAGLPSPDPGPVSRRSGLERRLLLVGGALLGGRGGRGRPGGVPVRRHDLACGGARRALGQRRPSGIGWRPAGVRCDFAQTAAFLSFAARSFGWGTAAASTPSPSSRAGHRPRSSSPSARGRRSATAGRSAAVGAGAAVRALRAITQRLPVAHPGSAGIGRAGRSQPSRRTRRSK